MEANAKTAQKLFDGSDRYVVPSYQRPYVWEEERQWQPLWEDIERLANARLEGRDEVHFLGAVVLRQEASSPGGLSEWSVIDGQQRLTSLQLIFSALAAAARLDGVESEARRLEKLTLHDELDADGDERFRLWPTTINRAAFKAVVKPGGRDPDRVDDEENTIEEAWEFFRDKARDFAFESDEEEGVDTADPEANLRQRYAVLREAVAGMVQLVAIQLGKDDPAQVIFETLNARGTPLLATDLVKNALLERASLTHSDLSIDQIHEDYWAEHLGDHAYWSEEERLGRLVIPRSEVFLMHWLAMKAGEAIPSDELFDRFRRSFLDNPDAADPLELLKELGSDSDLWRGFADATPNTPMGSLLAFLKRIDITTFQPLILLLAKSEADQTRRYKAFEILESYIARRTITGLTTKDYNNLTGELIKAISRMPEKPDEALISALLRSQSDTTRWPGDDEIHSQLVNQPLYGWLGQRKIVALLGEVESSLRSNNKVEGIEGLPSGLQVEHLMPQSWQENWPLEDSTDEDQIAFRDSRIDLIGNLTLVAGNLNSSMSNGPWQSKRAALNKHSILLLNKELETRDRWDEASIDARSADLANRLVSRWPGPQHLIPEEWKEEGAEMFPELAEMTAEEVREITENARPYPWELFVLMAGEPERRFTFQEVADGLDWPDSRLPVVLEQFRRRWHKFSGRTPFHFGIDASGARLIWLDDQAASIVNEIVQQGTDRAEEMRQETLAFIELDEVRELVDLIPQRVDETPGCEAKVFSTTGNSIQFRGSAGRSAGGYFAKEWLFLWWKGRFRGDAEWFSRHLSKPEQVVVNRNGKLRLHVANAADLDVLLRALSGRDEMTGLAHKLDGPRGQPPQPRAGK
jgi:hypothetical protein